MTYERILYSVADGVGSITLNRPQSLNSLDIQTIDEVLDALGRVAPDGVRVMILTGSGRGFCSGADLMSYLGDRLASSQPGDIDLGVPMQNYYNPLAAALFDLEIPLITAVNGMAAGGGLAVALAGDVVIAAKSAAFALGFAKIGLMPDMGATWLLPRLLGRARGLGFALLDRPGEAMGGHALSARQAADWGLIWEAVEDQQLLERARVLAAGMARQPSAALVSAKRALKQSYGNDFHAQLALEKELQSALGRRADFHEGVAAFIEKREPKFSASA